MGATAGRTTLLGEGLQHQDGHSLVLASTVPPCQAYDPAFAYEVAAIVQAGINRMYSPESTDPACHRSIRQSNSSAQTKRQSARANHLRPPVPPSRPARGLHDPQTFSTAAPRSPVP